MFEREKREHCTTQNELTPVPRPSTILVSPRTHAQRNHRTLPHPPPDRQRRPTKKASSIRTSSPPTFLSPIGARQKFSILASPSSSRNITQTSVAKPSTMQRLFSLPVPALPLAPSPICLLNKLAVKNSILAATSSLLVASSTS